MDRADVAEVQLQLDPRLTVSHPDRLVLAAKTAARHHKPVQQQATRSPTPSPIAIAPPSAAFPDLTGKYKVGRKSYQWVDETREENMTPERGDKHSVIATVYYPAGDVYNIQHTTYVEPLLTETMRTSVGEAEQFLSTLVTHAYKDAPASREGGPFPVVLF